MENEERKKSIAKDLGITILVLAFMSVVVFFIYTKFISNAPPKTNNNINIDKIEGFGKSPEEAVAKFIYIAGNMGDTSQVNSAMLVNHTAEENNYMRRYDSYEEALKGIFPGSHMITIDQSNDILDYTNRLSGPVYYQVDKDSIKVSSTTNSRKIETPTAAEADKKSEAVDVRASFISKEILYLLKATDISSDGTYIENHISREYKDIVFTVVKEAEGVWKIYDIDERNEIGMRFSTGLSTEEALEENRPEAVTVREILPD